MKIVISGDWHFGAVISGWDMHDDIVKAAREVIQATYKADLFVLSGDLFHHSRPLPRTYATAIELLDTVGCPFVVIPGNHDIGKGFYKDKNSEMVLCPDALEPLRKINFRAESRFPKAAAHLTFGSEKNVILSFIGYISDSLAKQETNGQLNSQKFIDAEFMKASKLGSKAVFTHLNVIGAKNGSEESFLLNEDLRLPLSIAKNLPCPVFNSHIHKSQSILPNIYMPGSIIPTDFGDRDGSKGYIVYEV